jgi:hypothetical protein
MGCKYTAIASHRLQARVARGPIVKEKASVRRHGFFGPMSTLGASNKTDCKIGVTAQGLVNALIWLIIRRVSRANTEPAGMFSFAAIFLPKS